MGVSTFSEFYEALAVKITSTGRRQNTYSSLTIMNTHDNPMVAALEGSLQGSWSATTRANTRPAFVRFGEGDVGIGMLNAFFERAP